MKNNYRIPVGDELETLKADKFVFVEWPGVFWAHALYKNGKLLCSGNYGMRKALDTVKALGIPVKEVAPDAEWVRLNFPGSNSDREWAFPVRLKALRLEDYEKTKAENSGAPGEEAS